MNRTGITVVGDVFRENAQRFADKPAFVTADGVGRSFSEVHNRVVRLVSALRSFGLSKGDRVAILSKNCIEYVEVYGISMAGFIPVPLNWRLSNREMSAVLEDCRPTVLIFDEAFRSVVVLLKVELSFSTRFIRLGKSDSDFTGYEDVLGATKEEVIIAAVDPDDTACILYTSGTTGLPKGAELTNRGLLANCRTAIDAVLHLTADDISMAPMPLFHVGGMWYHLFPSFAAGCTTVLLPEFNPRSVLDLMQEHRVTNIHLVPAMIHALLQQSDVKEFDLSQLRLIFYAASCIPAELLRSATLLFSHCGFVQGYGSTECGMISCLTEEDHRTASKPGRDALLLSCGRSLAGVEIRFDLAAHGSDDDIGELVVDSPMTMARYWKNQGSTRAVMTNGWLRTGDLGRRDSEGYLYIIDRKSDMIVTGGEKVYPREVEEMLFQLPEVSDAAVFDLPDNRWVQMVVAAVVLKNGSAATPDDIIAQLKKRLASYKCPKQIFITTALPKNGAGKLLRKVLRTTYANHGGNGR